MIHTSVTRNSDNQIDGLHISVTAESLPNFLSLLDRALNCWDSAPKELKELGDLITHGRITQDHTHTKINTKQTSSEYFSPEERVRIADYIAFNGEHMWLEAIAEGTAHKIAKGK